MSRLGLTVTVLLLLCLGLGVCAAHEPLAANIDIQEYSNPVELLGVYFHKWVGIGVQYDKNATTLSDEETLKMQQESFQQLARIKFGRTSMGNHHSLSPDRLVTLRPSDSNEMPTVFYNDVVELIELQMRTIAALQYLQQKLGDTSAATQ